MHQIEGSSAEICNIVSVIDETAFQTNLLAVDAARARVSRSSPYLFFMALDQIIL
jgi:hypothetical protein